MGNTSDDNGKKLNLLQKLVMPMNFIIFNVYGFNVSRCLQPVITVICANK